METLHKVKGWLGELTEVGLLLVALGVVMGILFGPKVPFLGGDIVATSPRSSRRSATTASWA